MNARTLRRLVVLVCVAGIGGMIAGSVADNNAVAITFGLVTAAAALCLIVATAVAGEGRTPGVAGEQSARVEQLVDDLVDQGADQGTVRRLVREAVRLGGNITEGRLDPADEVPGRGARRTHP
jgi:hypothetical protein